VKILFTADVHIKLGQKNVPVAWAKNRYNALWDQLKELFTKADLFIIGGDIFDRLPTMEELEVYFELIELCAIPTIIYSGNHEAVKKDTTFLTNLKKVTTKVNPLVRIIDDFYTHKGVDFVPYNKLKELENTIYTFDEKILCTHVRGEIPPHVKPEMDLDVFNRWKVVLAGDLHSYDNCQRNILYPGSPVTTSFHRNRVDTGVLMLDSETLEHTWCKLQLPQLLRKTIKVGEEMPATDYDHTIYEIEGDMSELGSMLDSDLIDKKIVKRDTDTALILEPDLTIEEEVAEYLRYVLQLNEASIDKALQELNNYADKLETT